MTPGVDNMLGKVHGMPADFVQRQEAIRTIVVSEDSLAAVFAKPAHKIAELLPHRRGYRG